MSSVAVINTMSKNNLGKERADFNLQVTVHQGKPGKEFKVGALKQRPQGKAFLATILT